MSIPQSEGAPHGQPSPRFFRLARFLGLQPRQPQQQRQQHQQRQERRARLRTAARQEKPHDERATAMAPSITEVKEEIESLADNAATLANKLWDAVSKIRDYDEATGGVPNKNTPDAPPDVPSDTSPPAATETDAPTSDAEQQKQAAEETSTQDPTAPVAFPDPTHQGS